MSTKIVGLRFQYEGNYIDVLNKISHTSSFFNKSWFLDCAWIEGSTNNRYSDVNNKLYTGTELLKMFSTLDNDFVYFLRLQRYDKPRNITPLLVFNDYLQSNCDMILLVSDSYYYEVYSKNENELLDLQCSFGKLNMNTLETLTNDNNLRKSIMV